MVGEPVVGVFKLTKYLIIIKEFYFVQPRI